MDKTKQWSILAALAVVAVFVGGWFVAVSPQRSKASDLKEQASAQQSANQTLMAQLASLKAQHRDLPKVQAQLVKLSGQLPDNPALPTLIRQLSDAADSAGVDLVSLSPSDPAFAVSPVTAPVLAPPASTDSSSSDSSSAPAAPAPVAPVATERLAYVPLTVVVNGSYFEVEQFFSNLEAIKRSFLVTGGSFEPGAPTTDGASGTTSTSSASGEYTDQLNATIDGRVFMVAQPAATAVTSPVAPVTTTK
jgi:Tfp pilus assembly protein PilO